jgi:tripartite-type tricarboxylate transporter receptor subunit TctC
MKTEPAIVPFHSLWKGIAVAAIGALALLCSGMCSLAQAQSYPSKPIHIIVPFAAGGGVDVLTRVIGPRLAEQLGQPVIVDNRPGANANIGANAAAKSAADGYTLFMASSIIAVNRTLIAKLPYDALKDFAFIARIGFAPSVLVCLPTFPAKSVSELIAVARAKPGTLSFGSPGIGSSHHLAGEMLKLNAKIDAIHVAYKGGAPAINDLLGGQISFMFAIPSEVLPQISANRLRALAVGSRQRVSFLPDVPTMRESGVPEFESITWWGLVAPAGTPKAIVDRLNAETNKALALPAVKEALAKLGVEVDPATPEQFAEFFAAEAAKYATLVKSAGIKAE